MEGSHEPHFSAGDSSEATAAADVVQNYRKFAEDAAKANRGYDAFLLALTEQEVAQRDANRQRQCIKAARFPLLKELADFDFSCVPSLNKQQVLDLARGSYLPKAEPILLVGNPGLGKTHVAISMAGSPICSSS